MKPKGHKRGCQCVVCAPKRRRARRNHGYENQAAALHERARKTTRKATRKTARNSAVMLPGSVKSRSAAKRRVSPTRINPSDPHLVDELVLYAENTGELYPMIQATQKSLLTKMRKGDFDILKAGKAWMRVMNRAAQMYTREMGVRGPYGSYGQFSSGTRSGAAGRMQSYFSTQAATGELDYLLPKKYQRKNPAHYPRTSRGPKGNVRWYILDLFDGRGNKLSTRVRKCARAKCATEAAQLVDRKVGKHMVRKVELSGPYSRKPGASTKRK